jgi:hypothetical protein
MAIVGVALVELHLPEARSLKDKRRIVKGLLERLHQRHRVSIAETDHHDLHQRAELVLAAVARTEQEAERMMNDVRAELEREVGAQLTTFHTEAIDMA